MKVIVHASNVKHVDRIMAIVDSDGNSVISATQLLILQLIGRFPAENGCYLTPSNMIDHLSIKKMTVQTLKRHIKYLQYIEAISVTTDGNKVIYRLRTPSKSTCESMRDFRVKTRMSGYSYARKEGQQEFDSLFLGDDEGKLHRGSFPNDRGSFPQNDVKTSSSTDEVFHHSTNIEYPVPNVEYVIKKENTPPYPPSHEIEPFWEDEEEDLVETLVKESAMSDNVPFNLEGEPLEKVVGKNPKTLKDRRAQAVALYDKGHLVNPLGKPNTRGRRLMPSRARPIGDAGAVTVSQLWAAYLEIFEKSFGKGILESIMAGTRENVSRYFDEMRQRFQDAAGYVASNRDLYEYLKHFHDTQRLQGLMKNGKYTGNIGYVHPNQVLGKVHIRRYYDEVLVHKNAPMMVSDAVAKHHHVSDFVREAFDKIREAWGEPDDMVHCLVGYGYVIVAEYMSDFHGYGGSESKRRIIETMAKFLRGPRDRKKAIAYLEKIWVSTERNSAVESSIWQDWKSTCKDFVQLAQEMADKN